MATLHLTMATTVADLRKQFNDAFGAQVKIYNGNKVAEPTTTLSELGMKSAADFDCPSSLTAASFIEKMKEKHGLKVKVYTCDEWVAVLDGLTLESAGKVKKNAVKADMEKLISDQKSNSAEVVAPVKENNSTAKAAKVVEKKDDAELASQKAETEAAKKEIERLKAELAKAKNAEAPKEEKKSNSKDPFEGLMVEVCAGVFVQGYKYQKWEAGHYYHPGGDKRKKPVWQSGSWGYLWFSSRKVTISKPFRICKYPITQGQWKAIMGEGFNLSAHRGDDNLPVTNVTWKDVQTFIDKLNKMTGKKYRLPTEAEWHWAACGAGKDDDQGKWAGCDKEEDLCEYAWYSKNSEDQTHPVGQKKPNEIGLYDMSGNVWEICQDYNKKDGNDYWHHLGKDSVIDPCELNADSKEHILKGGCFDRDATYSDYAIGCAISCHGTISEDSEGSVRVGFRLAMDK